MTAREDGVREAERRFGKRPEPGQQLDNQQETAGRAAGRAEATGRFGTTTNERDDR